MKTLYEGILADMDDTIKTGDTNIDKFEIFGKKFIFDRAVVGSASSSMLNKLSLKKLTNKMSYMSDKIERGQFDKQDKVKLFANMIDHLSFTDLDIYMIGDTGEDFRKNLTNKLNKYFEDNNIFNNIDRTHMWVVSERATGKDELHIIVARKDKMSASHMFKLYYKIE